MLRFCVLCILCVLSACATPYLLPQQVPVVIQQRLQQDYQGVKMLRWQKKDSLYTADFRRAKHNYHYVFDKKATVLLRKEEIKVATLSQKIVAEVQKKYPQYKLRRAAWVLKNETDTLYMAEIQRGMKFYQLFFKSDATYIQKNIVSADDKILQIDTSFLNDL
jgi:hypothetical protein